MAVAGAALWFGPELWGSGNALRAGQRARDPNPNALAFAEHPAWEVARRFDSMMPLVAELGLAAAVALGAVRRRLGHRGVLAVGALAWLGVVAVMTEAGFSGNARYLIAPVALSCVAGGAALGELLARVAQRPALQIALAGALLVPAVAVRADDLAGDGRAVRNEARLMDDLTLAVRNRGGADRFRRSDLDLGPGCAVQDRDGRGGVVGLEEVARLQHAAAREQRLQGHHPPDARVLDLRRQEGADLGTGHLRLSRTERFRTNRIDVGKIDGQPTVAIDRPRQPLQIGHAEPRGPRAEPVRDSDPHRLAVQLLDSFRGRLALGGGHDRHPGGEHDRRRPEVAPGADDREQRVRTSRHRKRQQVRGARRSRHGSVRTGGRRRVTAPAVQLNGGHSEADHEQRHRHRGFGGSPATPLHHALES